MRRPPYTRRMPMTAAELLNAAKSDHRDVG
jgi:hypothetical protein